MAKFFLLKKSLDESIFSSALEMNILSLFLKTENSFKVENYRPIANFSHLCKLFESLVMNYIQLSVNRILVDERYGFRPSCFIVT